MQRRAQLCRKRVPLAKRIRKYFGTVGLTLLHGLEGVDLSQGVLKSVQSFDRHCLRDMLCMRKPDDVGYIAFRRKPHAVLRRILSKMGVKELAAQLIAKHHGWAGHVARLDERHLAAAWAGEFTQEQWRLQQAVGEACDPCNKTKWRHSRRGPVSRWDGLLFRIIGGNWWALAQDRKWWQESRQPFVRDACDAFLGAGHRVFGV